MDLTIGSDVDYYDAITVASHADLQPQVDALANDFARRIEVFEGCVDSLTDVAAFLGVVPELSGIDLDAERACTGASNTTETGVFYAA